MAATSSTPTLRKEIKAKSRELEMLAAELNYSMRRKLKRRTEQKEDRRLKKKKKKKRMKDKQKEGGKRLDEKMKGR